MYYELTRRHTKRYNSLDVNMTAEEESTKQSTKGKSALVEMKDRLARRRGSATGALPEAELSMSRADIDLQWAMRVKKSQNNKARNLYADFEYEWRYWKLIILGQKFVLVVLNILMAGYGSAFGAAVSMCVVHGFMLGLTMFAAPYMDHRPDYLAVSISFANLFNMILAALAFSGFAMPEEMVYALLVVNLFFPIAALIAGWIRHKHDKKVAREKNRIYFGELWTTKEPPELVKQRRLIERDINENTLRLLVTWTSFVLICSCLAGGLVLMGSFSKQVTTPVRGHATNNMIPPNMKDCAKEDYMKTLEYIGYDSWETFTQSCCCMNRTTTFAGSLVPTELWVCDGASRNSSTTLYKERPRGNSSGTLHHVRPFCEAEFVDGTGEPLEHQEPEWNEEEQRFGVFWKRSANESEVFVSEFW